MPGEVEARGSFQVEDGVEWYRIQDVDRLEPFLVNVTSPYDHWMFVSSAGALTAGRVDVDRALFPYETDDRLHRSQGRSGPITIVRALSQTTPWEPFASHVPLGQVQRSLAKSVEGGQLRFTERHPDLGLTFRSTWSSSRSHGLVRVCDLSLDDDAEATTVDVLDGLIDVLPAGVELGLQQTSSTLVDAYRRNELDDESGLAIFNLEAAISDQPMAAESLTANVVWSRGLPAPTVALSDRQLRAFRSGKDLRPEPLTTGVKGAYLQAATVDLAPGERVSWVVVADVARDHVGVARLRRWLTGAADPVSDVVDGVELARQELVALAAAQDAVQRSGDRAADVHHFANVLYNGMRGGAFLEGHRVGIGAVADAIGVRNAQARARFSRRVEQANATVAITDLRRAVEDDPELLRLVNEYLPLTFSRRHGDPSRPWNRFHIAVRDAEGDPVPGYEGNWRDIFQNWEALLHSFPDYLESVVSKFLSASTRDGHNPYRINHEGIDWEVPEDGSWGNFGYWGDHQIVYLHRLLETLHRFHPGTLESGLDRRAYAYADVPYRIRPYASLVRDAKHTLDFDHDLQSEIERRVEKLGTDGRLVVDAEGQVHHASLAEKLLVPALAKVANLVPGGGIWMNTQRPEWNDANNALVGNGLSVVTAFHLRDYLAFLLDVLADADAEHVPLDPAVEVWMRATAAAFNDHAELLDPAAIDNASRRRLLDALGGAYDAYRARVYEHPPTPPRPVSLADLIAAVAVCLAHVEVVTSTAVRPDGLFDSYRLLSIGDGTAEVEPLYEMLEGQAAGLGGRDVDPANAVATVEQLFASELFREDQGSFLLYPDRDLPPFLERNAVGDELLTPSLEALVGGKPQVLRRDVDGTVRFEPAIRNAHDLAGVLDEHEGTESVDAETRAQLLSLHETVFNHRSFTGRSQSMYRYEGLGSIYWHMVAKLLASVQRCFLEAVASGASEDTVGELREAYLRVRDGLGYRKPVNVQGAFPLDPHSHTPGHAGAQQPGMTGAVKEGVLLRLGELGVSADDGIISFEPRLLTDADFLDAPVAWPPLGPAATLEPGTLGFTYCGVPIVYRRADDAPWIQVTGPGASDRQGGHALDRETSRLLTSRSGAISRIDVGVRAPAERH